MSGGSYTVRWSAADPELNKGPLAPTYDKLTPAEYLATYGSYPVGFATDPLANAESATPAGANDSVSSLAPKGVELGQIVPFFLTVTVNGSTLPENGTITINPYWLTKTTNGGDFGFDPAYKVLAAFVDRGDPVFTDPGLNATVSGFTSAVTNSGTSNEQIQGAITLSGLNSGDTVTVEVWVVLKDVLPPGGVTGNVQTGLLNAVTAAGDTISTGNQTVPLLRTQDFYNATADLSIVKSDNAASITSGQDADPPLYPGDTFTYYLTAANLSTDTVANSVVVTDALPAGVTFLSATGGGSLSGGNVTWSLGGVSPLETINLAVTVRVNTATTAGSILTNTASITAFTQDPDTTNNTNAENTAILSPVIPARADLSVIKSDNAASVTAGQDADPTIYAGSTFTYTIRAANAGTDAAANVVVSDALPAGVTFVSATGGGTLTGSTVNWNVGNLAAGASQTYTVTVRVDNATQAGSLANTASITSSTSDPDTTNNTNTENTQVLARADLSVIKSDNAASVTAGQDADPTIYAGSTFTYTIRAANAGTDAAANVVVSDALPAGVTFVSATGGGTLTGSTVNWNVGNLAAGASQTYTVTVRVDNATQAGSLANTASITSSTSDPDTTNNTNTENTEVLAPVIPGKVSGNVFLELPPGICGYKLPDAVFAGIKVELISAAGQIVATTLTDVNGNYQFNTVLPGQYLERFTNPDGTEFTQPKVAGTLNPRDSDVNPDGLTDLFSIVSGGDVKMVNAGLDYTGVGLTGLQAIHLPDGGGSYNFNNAGAYAIGGQGSYNMMGNGGSVYFIGGTGANNLQGSGNSGAILMGGGGANIMEGTGGRDIIIGGCGPNNMQGLGSNNFQGLGGGHACWPYDLLVGGVQNDIITSNSGRAIIIGGRGDDALDGQGVFVGGPNHGTVSFDGTSITAYAVGDHLKLSGLSTVHYQVGDGVQWIENFNPGRGDTIEVWGHAAPTATGVVNGQYVMYFGPDSAIVLNGYQPQNGPLNGVNYHPGQSSMPGAFGHLDALPPVILAAGQDSFTGSQGDDIALGTHAFTTFLGNAGDDLALGGDGGNLFIDGAGNDTYVGGRGNDIFRLTEGSNEVIGCDGNNVVQLGVTRSQATITPNANGTFTVVTPAGAQILKDIQWISFTDQNVHLPGVADGPGAVLFGTASGDQFQVTNNHDLIVERPGQGQDTAWVAVNGWTLSPEVENGRLYGQAADLTGNAMDNVLVANATTASALYGGRGNDDLWGGTGADTLDGGAGDDVLRSGSGVTTMVGGAGNDQFVVNNAADGIVEKSGEGIDTAWVGVSGWTVSDNVEIVRLFGGVTSVTLGSSGAQVVADASGSTIVAQLGDNVFWGNGGTDTFVGGAGQDIFYAGGGVTSMHGGAGHDSFIVRNVADQVFENLAEGLDTAYVTVNGWTVGDHVEVAYLTATATALTGNATGTNLVANSTAASTLTAGAGQTIFWGSSFDDTFNAGPGGSIIYGYGGADDFHFGVPHWGTAEISDFSHAEGDQLDFRGSGITAAGQLTLTNYADKVHVQHGADQIILYGVTAPLVASDFIF